MPFYQLPISLPHKNHCLELPLYGLAGHEIAERPIWRGYLSFYLSSLMLLSHLRCHETNIPITISILKK